MPAKLPPEVSAALLGEVQYLPGSIADQQQLFSLRIEALPTGFAFSHQGVKITIKDVVNPCVDLYFRATMETE